MSLRLLLFLIPTLLLAAPPDLQSILDNRVKQAKKAHGILVGTIDASGNPQFVSAGPDLSADSVLEIGSITKVFTSLLLADMVERGEVTLDTPVSKLLPAGSKIPTGASGREITLLHLSQQTSGLPRLPNNLRPADPTNPYADYTPAQLLEFLASHTLSREPGDLYEYSNLGVGLLGYALSQKLGTTYEEAIRTRILKPLGMQDTSITLSESQRKRLLPGHDPALRPVRNWDFQDATGPAGALRSTPRDMLRFLAAAAGISDTPLKSAFARLRSVSKSTPQPDLNIQMGWHVWNRYGKELVWHNGGTGGYRSFAGFVPAEKRAIIVLCDTSHGVDDIGRHWLVPEWPVDTFKVRTAITLPEETLETYVGQYRLTPQVTFTVTRRGTRLFIQATGQGEGEVFAEKPGEFFAKIVDAQFTFISGPDGKAAQLILHQNGRDLKMERIP